MIDKYYVIFNNSVGQHSVTISRAEFANLLGVFSKHEQQLDQLKVKEQKLDKIKETINYYSGIHCSKCKHYKTCTSIDDCVNTIIKEVLQIIEDKK